MNEKKSESWAAEWDDPRQGKAYGDVFYQRAVGDLPEMECSKAAAKKIVNIARPGDRIVDVGCGSGHYLRSLLDQIETPFAYHGIDRTQYFVDLAQRAFGNCKSASFSIGDIFKLAEADQSADIVMCNNVLLHLPSIAGPLHELIRIARRAVLVRTLVGPTSYSIRDIGPQPDGNDFDDNGEPTAFHYLNIYSESYVRRLLKRESRVRSVVFEQDMDYDPSRIADSPNTAVWDATRTVNGMQISGMIVMPYHWILMKLG